MKIKRKKIETERKRAKRNRNRGRYNESALAKIMGFEKKGLYGGEDAYRGDISAEYKSFQTYRGFSLFKQAIRNCKKAKRKIPILVVHLAGTNRKGALVHMRVEDWNVLFQCALEGGYAKKIRDK